MGKRILKLIAVLSFAAPLISVTAQDRPNAPSQTECYMPEPDILPPANPLQAVAAKDASAKITVDVSKPFPKCAADVVSIDPSEPKLGRTAAGDPTNHLGSPECLLLGVANSNFDKCASKKAGAEAEHEKASPDYVVINLVQWSVRGSKPARNSSWYLYDRKSKKSRAWKVTDGLRIRGSEEVGFLAVHFGIDDTCGIQYTVEAKERTPTNRADLQELYQAVASAFSGLPSLSTATGTQGLPDNSKQQLEAAFKAAPHTDKLLMSHKIFANKDNRDSFVSTLKSAGSKEASTLSGISDQEKQAALFAYMQKSPSLTNLLSPSTLKLEPAWFKKLNVPLPTKKEPGVGVYGYAAFKGLEKLPYDLTLTGTPAGTVRTLADTEKDTERFASTLAKIRVFPVAQRRDNEDVAITWNGDVAVTCAPLVPIKEEQSSSLLKHPAASHSHDWQGHPKPEYLRAVSARIGEGGFDSPTMNALKTPQNGSPQDGKDKEQANKQQANNDDFTLKQTYQNEGLYRWDVSIGVPALTAKKTTFTASDGTVQSSTSLPGNPYAFFDYFLKKADLVKWPPVRWPSISAGIPIGSQPFNRAVMGTSIGFNLWGFHFSPFVGALALREYRPKNLQREAATTDAKLKADLQPELNWRLFVSINFSVKDAENLIKNKGSSQSSDSKK